MIRTLALGAAIALWLLVVSVQAEDPDAESRHPDIGSFEDLVDHLNSGHLSLTEARKLGLSVFSTPFNIHDGLGDGPFYAEEWEEDPLAFGHRPSLQGNGQFLRTNGLDAQSCNECHTIVSNATNPPTLGIGGVGGMAQNAMIMASVVDNSDSADDRVAPDSNQNPELPMEADGVADFNGRFANPPFLYGGGAVELLAKEMTEDLQAHLEETRNSPPGTVVSLDTHNVNFGYLTSLGDGEVDLSEVHGVGSELVVKPFGRKGEFFSMRAFDREAMQFHFGIQPVEVIDPEGTGGVDEDNDGVTDEVTVAEMSVLHIFDVTNPSPFMERLDHHARKGFRTFKEIGCADCHRPALTTRSDLLPLAHPEVPDDPSANTYFFVDLIEVGFEPAPDGGVRVPLFADLKRHKMGPRLAETFERGGEIAQEEFTTARLWGIADTAPYLHDGRATTLFQAIELHGGEAQAARDAFMHTLSAKEQENLIAFLKKLRVPSKPNEELVDSH